MNRAEKLALNSSLPQLLEQIVVNTRFKAGLLSSGILDSGCLDSLFSGKGGQELIFELIHRLRKANESGAFSTFVQVLKTSGQHGAAEVLDTELIKHTHHLSQTSVERENMRAGAVAQSAIRNTTITEDSEDEDCKEADPSTGVPQTQVAVCANISARQDAVLRCLQLDSDTVNTGDIAVKRKYYESLRDFKSRRSSVHPQPFQSPDVSRRSYSVHDICFISPPACSELCKLLGGKPSLVRDKSEGHPVLRKLDGSIVFCCVILKFQPGELWNNGCWISVQHTLAETLTDYIEWSPYHVRNSEASEDLDLGITVAQWYKNSPTTALCVRRFASKGALLSLEGKQKLVQQSLMFSNRSKHAAPIHSHYHKKLQSFGRGHSSTLPGPLQAPSVQSAASNEKNLSFLALEACATFLELFGGEVEVLKTKKRGLTFFIDSDNAATHVGAIMCSQTFDNEVGRYYLSLKLTLRDAVGAATGCMPHRARAQSSDEDLDLDMTVKKWFKMGRGIVICVWFDE